jgi:hypothetical protein
VLIAGLSVTAAACALTGEITHLSGALVAHRPDGSRILSIKSEVREGDTLITAENTYARIKWGDGTDVVMRPSSQLKIDLARYEEGKPQEDGFALSLLKGGLRAITGVLAKRNPARFRVATPTATVGIRGTHFGVLECNDDCAGIQAVGGGVPSNGLHVDVSDGAIVVTNPAGSLEYRAGEFGHVASFTVPPVVVPPAQGTRITPPSTMLNMVIQGAALGQGTEQECTIR